MAMKARYTVLGGQIVAEKRGASRKFYASDALSSTVALYDNTQTKTDSFTYWPYGETRTSTGATGTKFKYVGTLGCRTQFDGGIYMRARVQQPDEGRWMTVDPTWPSEDQYEYCWSSPTNNVDTNGSQPTKWSSSDPLSGHCAVKVCSMYGFADDKDANWWDKFIVTHQYVCAITSKGRICKFSIGGSDALSPCNDSNTNGFPIRCQTVTTDCKFALAACYCMKKLNADSPKHEVPWTVCWHSKQYVKNCMQKLFTIHKPPKMKGKFEYIIGDEGNTYVGDW